MFCNQIEINFVFVKDLSRVVLKVCDGIGHGAYHSSSGSDVAIETLTKLWSKR